MEKITGPENVMLYIQLIAKLKGVLKPFSRLPFFAKSTFASVEKLGQEEKSKKRPWMQLVVVQCINSFF